METSLYRSQTDRLIGGVCGGIAEYLRISATPVRVYFLLLAFTTGIGWLLYLILWAALPYPGEGTFGSPGAVRQGIGEIAGKARDLGDDVRRAVRQPDPQIGVALGVALMLIGTLALLRNLGIPGLGWLNEGLVWPLLLLIGGIVLIWRLPR